VTPPGEELPALPSTAIGRTATALPLDQSDVRVSPRTSDHRGSAVWQCFGSVGSACPLTSIFPGRVLESIDRRWRPYIGLGNRNIGNEYTHCGKVFELIDGRFAIYRPSPKSLAGRRHENEGNATVIGNLHGGMAERRDGGGGTSTGTKALFYARDSAPLSAAPNSARRRRRRALCFPI